MEEYAIEDQAGVLLLNTAMETFDRMRGAQRAIKRDGLVVYDKWGQAKAHPLLTVERDSRSQMLASLKALNLDLRTIERPTTLNLNRTLRLALYAVEETVRTELEVPEPRHDRMLDPDLPRTD